MVNVPHVIVEGLVVHPFCTPWPPQRGYPHWVYDVAESMLSEYGGRY